MLLFQSLDEAVSSIGRPLSYAETLWFRYTSEMPEFVLCVLNFVFLVVVFSLYPLPLAVVQVKAPHLPNRFKIQPHTNATAGLFLKTYRDAIVQLFLVVGPLHLTSYWYPLTKALGIRTSLPLPSVWEIGAQLIVYMLVDDYGQYWLHRWLHSGWGYRRIHHVHHEFSAPNGFAAAYADPLEILILGMPTSLGPALVPCHIVTLWLWTSLRYIQSIETYLGFDFPWSPTKLIPFYGGPQFHDYHHYVGRHGQSNFAPVFTFCDYIYGTDKMGHNFQMADPTWGTRILLQDAHVENCIYGNVVLDWGYRHHKQLQAKMRKMAYEKDGEILKNSSHGLKSQ